MKIRYLTLLLFLATVACGQRQGTQAPVELKHFPLDSMEGVRAASGVSFDPTVTSDGHGSLKIEAAESTTVPLFEVTDVAIDNATLIYQANLQTEGLQGQTYLEMWVRFPEQGEYFSRGLDRPLSGTTSWATVTTPFFLEAGQQPDLIRLNLVVNGKGKVWIDDIRLLRQPLQ
ncbi:MAG: hypothetical protein HYX73_05560 [Acidobacteria bacterium]|nr:hypothetical protein [Acidobacteriota bacterium]